MTGQDSLETLLGRCARGDRQALETLYRLTSPKLYGVALALLKRADLAEDVLQDGYMKIWTRSASYNPGKGAPMTWMISIVRNRALDLLRSAALHMERQSQNYEDLELPSAGQEAAMYAKIDVSASAVRDCLEQLKETQRRCILLAYYYGHTHEELALLLKCPLGTVKAWIRRGMERLRECLD